MDWSLLFEKRYEIHKRYPQIWDVPLWRKRFGLVSSHMKKAAKILDVGADKREWESRFKAHDPDCSYSSMDINRSQNHDFYDLEAITGEYDLILLLEVIEHIPLEKGEHMLRTLYQRLAPGGVIVLTTPNIWRPSQYLRDATHVQPYAYDELGGLLTYCQFDLIGIWRLWNSHVLDRFTRLTVGKYLHRYVGVDFAKTLMAVAKKNQ